MRHGYPRDRHRNSRKSDSIKECSLGSRGGRASCPPSSLCASQER